MSPYSRYGPLQGSDTTTVLPPPGADCRLTTACRFLRWLSRLGPHTAAAAAKNSGNHKRTIIIRCVNKHKNQ